MRGTRWIAKQEHGNMGLLVDNYQGDMRTCVHNNRATRKQSQVVEPREKRWIYEWNKSNATPKQSEMIRDEL